MVCGLVSAKGNFRFRFKSNSCPLPDHLGELELGALQEMIRGHPLTHIQGGANFCLRGICSSYHPAVALGSPEAIRSHRAQSGILPSCPLSLNLPACGVSDSRVSRFPYVCIQLGISTC